MNDLVPGTVVRWYRHGEFDSKWDYVRVFTSWPPDKSRNVHFLDRASDRVMVLVGVDYMNDSNDVAHVTLLLGDRVFHGSVARVVDDLTSELVWASLENGAYDLRGV